MHARRLFTIALCAGAAALAASTSNAAIRVQASGGPGVTLVQDSQTGTTPERGKRMQERQNSGKTQNQMQHQERSGSSGSARTRNRQQEMQQDMQRHQDGSRTPQQQRRQQPSQ